MKWFALLSCCVIAVLFSACEKHDASELKKIDEPAEHEAAHASPDHAVEPVKTPADKK